MVPSKSTMKPIPSQLINSIDHVWPYWYTNYKQNNYYTTISKCKRQQHMGSALNIVLFQMNQLRFNMVVSGSLNANILMFAGEILWVNTSPSGLRLHLILSIECLRLKLCWKISKDRIIFIKHVWVCSDSTWLILSTRAWFRGVLPMMIPWIFWLD